jgi:hypothetical protein
MTFTDYYDKKLFKFQWDAGRMGRLEGLFIATKSQVDEIIGKHIYFGEVLGKHSEIQGVVERYNVQMISDEHDFCEYLEQLFGSMTLCGINPLSYYEPEEDQL